VGGRKISGGPAASGKHAYASRAPGYATGPPKQNAAGMEAGAGLVSVENS